MTQIQDLSQEDGIKLLEIAGFEVVINGETFSLYEDGDKLYGFSNIKWLSDINFIINNIIKSDSHKKGFWAGEQKIKNQFKKLMDL